MEPPPSFRLQKGDMKQVPYWGPRILECTVNLTVTWYLVLDACKWMHFCMQRKEQEKLCSTYYMPLQNLVTWATSHLMYVCPCTKHCEVILAAGISLQYTRPRLACLQLMYQSIQKVLLFQKSVRQEKELWPHAGCWWSLVVILFTIGITSRVWTSVCVCRGGYYTCPKIQLLYL
jgi:hypothetical protein